MESVEYKLEEIEAFSKDKEGEIIPSSRKTGFALKRNGVGVKFWLGDARPSQQDVDLIIGQVEGYFKWASRQ